jgi:hypothetical protein
MVLSTTIVVIDDRFKMALRMQYEMTLITLANSLYAEESTHDLFDDEFEAIVTIAESLTAKIESIPSKPGIAPVFNFSLDTGVIQPLTMTALKCRQRRTMNRALSLLQSMASSTEMITQEGGWDAIIFAKAIGRVVAVEEEGLDLSGFQRVPEHRRIHQVTVAPGQNVRFVTLRMTRLPNGTDGGWEVMIETIMFNEPSDRDAKPSSSFIDEASLNGPRARLSIRATTKLR